MADQDDLGPAVQMIEAGEEDDVHAPVFIDEDHGKVVADLDEEDDAGMSDPTTKKLVASPTWKTATPPARTSSVPPTTPSLSSHHLSAPVYPARGAPRPRRRWRPATRAARCAQLITDNGAGGAAYGATVTVVTLAHRLRRAFQPRRFTSRDGGSGRSRDDLGVNGGTPNPRGTRRRFGVGPVASRGERVRAGEDFTAWMWNATDGALMQVFSGPANMAGRGGHLAGREDGGDGVARRLARRQPRTSASLRPVHGSSVPRRTRDVPGLHPTTQGLMLTGSEDNTARLVSASNGKVLGNLVAHTRRRFECVGLSGDFPFAASGAIDAKLVVWDLNTLQPRNTLKHDKAVSALRWIPGTACLYRCALASRWRRLVRG